MSENETFVISDNQICLGIRKPEQQRRKEEEDKNILENHSLLNDIEDKEIIFNEEGKFSKIKSIANLSKQKKQYKNKKNKKLPINVTKQYPILDRFIIIPFSPLHYFWGVLILLACTYTLFIVPF